MIHQITKSVKGHFTAIAEIISSAGCFTVQHCTISFDLEHQAADDNFFRVKAELSPTGERHPQVWATAAQEQGPGTRLAHTTPRKRRLEDLDSRAHKRARGPGEEGLESKD
ncbi:hypothetical protein BDV38DRAFT_231635 [Aspergillus pseudotamarii]|uniref:Uncharacterized protein n=1 Tax=Aspergillus pseudotamarii TaxID=132259 RepID=A0A5N6TB63_ASPPS|nr:uncharacterized protein BDV38DRAFT_231635 [Aspergillus pseudotamarii]KAE8143552.1 hypothetical protein BDV38DRAFT_231635 [Aspergillus pseudotamarii]